jgi:hypothetical protein
MNHHHFKTAVRSMNIRQIAVRTAYAAGRLRHAAAGDAALWLCFRNRRASATNEMPNTIE